MVKRNEPYDSITRLGVTAWGECLLFNGARNVEGYCLIKNLPGMSPGTMGAHRVAYQKLVGEISGWDTVIDHMCHNIAAANGDCRGGRTCKHRACVNPTHLRAISRCENTQASPIRRTKMS